MKKTPSLCLAGRALFLASTLGLAGCSEYLDRRETVLLGAGNAVQTNIVMQQIDPWPRNARNRDGATSGERLQHAMERYRNPRAGTGTSPAETRPVEATQPAARP